MIKTDEVKDVNVTIGDKQITNYNDRITISDMTENQSLNFTKEQFIKILSLMKVLL